MSLLEISELSVRFGEVAAVEKVTFSISRGERVALIGESGSGKSMVCLTVQGLQPRNASVSGRIRLDGAELPVGSDSRLRPVRGRAMGSVFQEPMTALNPVMTIGSQLTTALRAHGLVSRRGARARASELAALVGLPDPPGIIDLYPHQLSGGQRQRVVIAMALSCEPDVVLADEPTTALDATVARKVLDLMVGLCADLGSALLLVTHDMAVAATTCERLMVMRRGRLVEQGRTPQVLSHPAEPYTRRLITAARVTGLDLAAAHQALGHRPEGTPA